MNRLSGAGKNARLSVLIIIIIALIGYFGFFFPFRGLPFNASRHGNPPLTPAWALECWLWEDDFNTSERVDTLLEGYLKYDIPVRTILLDSPWSMRYNDFIIDTILYPDPDVWFGKLQSRGYRVVLWMTSMVNSSSKDTRFSESGDWFKEACMNGYLAGKGEQIKWWKGRGGFVDYSNSAALTWWHNLQQKVFDLGIDGWKLDGTATLFRTMLGPVPLFYKTTSKGIMTTRNYMDHYYRDEYLHGLSRNPEFVTLVRAIDRGYHPEGFAPVDAAPVTWVGDQKHTWKSSGKASDDNSNSDIAMDGIEGIEMAISSILKSAEMGYNIIGSDVAGFSGSEIPPGLYIRWAQFSAFCGLFLNGGHGERALWKRSPQELEIIRKFSWLHTELIPYIYTYVVNGHNGGEVLQRPFKDNYQYYFGDYFMVAPVYEDKLTRRITLPEGTWRYFFSDDEIIRGPVTFEREFPIDEYPVYVREGAIVPMDIKRSYTGIGDSSSEGYLTLLIYPHMKSEFVIHHPDKSGSTKVEVEELEDKMLITLRDVHKSHILKINIGKKPEKVKLDNLVLAESLNWIYDEKQRKLIIRTDAYIDGRYIVSK